MKTTPYSSTTHSNLWRTLTVADRFIYTLLLILSALSVIAVKGLQPEGSEVIIEVKGEVVYRGSLFEDFHLEVEGLIGTTAIEIENERAWVSFSDCPHHICVRTGKIHRAGEVIVCIPNKVVVKVKKPGSSHYDAITG